MLCFEPLVQSSYRSPALVGSGARYEQNSPLLGAILSSVPTATRTLQKHAA